MSDYQDLNALASTGEEIDVTDIESNDYSPFEVPHPGNYLSQSREIRAKQKDDGTVTFELTFVGGLTDPNTGKVIFAARPEKTWLSTKKYTRTGRPGQTSSVAEYLRACGMDPKQVGSLTDALLASQSIPLLVYVAWEDRSEKVGDTWVNAGLKTRDFNQGSKEEPHYVPQVEKDGKVYTARARVTSSFQQIR